MRSLRLFVVVTVAMLASAQLAISAAPQLISFQARVTDASNASILDGPHSIVFTLYDTTSAAVWTETQSVTTTTGLFTTLLGGLTPLQTLSWDASYSLGLAIDGGAELSPRYALAASPYSLDNKWTIVTAQPTHIRLRGSTGDSTWFGSASTDQTGLAIHRPSQAAADTAIDARAASTVASLGLYVSATSTGPAPSVARGMDVSATTASDNAVGGKFTATSGGAGGGGGALAYGVDISATSFSALNAIGANIAAQASGVGPSIGVYSNASSVSTGRSIGVEGYSHTTAGGAVIGALDTAYTTGAGLAYGLSAYASGTGNGPIRGANIYASRPSHGGAVYGTYSVAQGNGTISDTAFGVYGQAIVAGTAVPIGVRGIVAPETQDGIAGSFKAATISTTTGNMIGAEGIALSAASSAGAGTTIGLRGLARYAGSTNNSFTYGVQGIDSSSTENAAGGKFTVRRTGPTGFAHGVDASASADTGRTYGGYFLGTLTSQLTQPRDTAYGLYATATVAVPGTGVPIAARFDGDVILNGHLITPRPVQIGTVSAFGFGTTAMPITASFVTISEGATGTNAFTFTTSADSGIVDIDVTLTTLFFDNGADYAALRLWDGAATIGQQFEFHPPFIGTPPSTPKVEGHARWVFRKTTTTATTYSVLIAHNTGTASITATSCCGWNQMAWTFTPH